MSKDKKSESDATKAVHGGGYDPHSHGGAVNPPVYHVSTVAFPTVEEFETRGKSRFTKDRMVYGVMGTPTHFVFEKAVAELEGGYDSVVVGSGLTAVTCALAAFLQPGDHVLISDNAYFPTRSFAKRQLAGRMGIEVDFYDPLIGGGIAGLIKDNTKVIHCESPGSLTFEVQDIPAIARSAHEYGVKVVMDNTWATPCFFKSFDHGVDVSVHAATKYIGGLSDLMLGVMVCTEESFQTVRSYTLDWGHFAGPDDVNAGLRGLRSLPARMKIYQENGLAVAEWLQGHPKVARVLHPALPDDPGHALWQRDFLGASALFGVQLKEPPGDAGWAAFMNNLEYFVIGASWGGAESIIQVAHPEKYRTATTWDHPGTLFRLSIGLEDPDDLIRDLEQGLARLG